MAEYNPNKRYAWSNEDSIEISGRDFGLFLNTFRAILSSEQPMPVPVVLLADKCNDVVEAIMAEYVEKDVIKEVEDTPDLKITK